MWIFGTDEGVMGNIFAPSYPNPLELLEQLKKRGFLSCKLFPFYQNFCLVPLILYCYFMELIKQGQITVWNR